MLFKADKGFGLRGRGPRMFAHSQGEGGDGFLNPVKEIGLIGIRQRCLLVPTR